MTETRSCFSPKLPTLQLAWDATSLKNLYCPRLYQQSIIRGIKDQTSFIHLDWGLLYHNAREKFHNLLLLGLSHDEASFETIKFALADSYSYQWDSDKLKNRRNLLRGIIWAIEEFKGVDNTYIFPDGKPGIELSFAIPLGIKASTGEDYILCGHMDRLIEYNGEIWGYEYKTSKSTVYSHYYQNQWEPETQISLYNLALQLMYGDHLDIRGVIVEACQVAVGFSRFRRIPISKTEEQNAEFLNDLRAQVKLAEQSALADYWPKQEGAVCGLYGGCDFRKLCLMQPKTREDYLGRLTEHTDFIIDKWNPLDVR